MPDLNTESYPGDSIGVSLVVTLSVSVILVCELVVEIGLSLFPFDALESFPFSSDGDDAGLFIGDRNVFNFICRDVGRLPLLLIAGYFNMVRLALLLGSVSTANSSSESEGSFVFDSDCTVTGLSLCRVSSSLGFSLVSGVCESRFGSSKSLAMLLLPLAGTAFVWF